MDRKGTTSTKQPVGRPHSGLRGATLTLLAAFMLTGCEDVSLNLGPPERPPPLRPAGGALRRSVTQPATTPAAELP